MAIDWNAFPQRGLDEVFGMVREAMIDGINDLGNRRLMVDRIAMGRHASEFWRARWRDQERFSMRGGRGVVDVADFMGAAVILDAFQDRIVDIGEPTTMSDIRLITAGNGSHRITFASHDQPYRFSTMVEVVGFDGRRHARRFDYNYILNLNVQVQEGPVTPAPARAIPPTSRREMSAVRIAWLT